MVDGVHTVGITGQAIAATDIQHRLGRSCRLPDNDRRVLLVCAPAGFGKSAYLHALAEHYRAQRQRLVFLTLDPLISQPPRFCEALAHGLAESGIQEAMQVSAPLPSSGFFEHVQVCIEAAAGELVLMIDDAHFLEDPALVEGMNRLVQFAPAGFRLVIGCRGLPGLSWATWRAKNWLDELGADELRVSAPQWRSWLQQAAVPLSPEEADTLYELTQGWVQGLRLVLAHAAEQLPGQPLRVEPGQDCHAILMAAMARVYDALPPCWRECLLQLGVASRLNGALAGELAGVPSGQALLEQLETLQVFLFAQDAQRHWYEFHPLFADYLCLRLQRESPSRFEQLHGIASRWCHEQQLDELAINHACLAGDSDNLAALLDSRAFALINKGRFQEIYQWCQSIPRAVLQRYPLLLLADTWYATSRLPWSEARVRLDELAAGYQVTSSASGWSDPQLAILVAKSMLCLDQDELAVSIALATRLEAQVGRHAALLESAVFLCGAMAHLVHRRFAVARRLLALSQQRNHLLDGPYVSLQTMALEVLSIFMQGYVALARSHYEQQVRPLSGLFEEGSRARSLASVVEALISYSQLELEAVDERILLGLKHTDLFRPVDLQLKGRLCVARLYRITGQRARAEALLEELGAYFRDSRSGRFKAEIVEEEVVLALQGGGLDRIHRAEKRFRSVDWPALQARESEGAALLVQWSQGISRVRLQQARGHFSEALHELGLLRQLLPEEGWGRQLIRIDLLAALSHQRLGYKERARQVLIQVLLDAESLGVRNLFVEEGEAVRHMLMQMGDQERQPALAALVRAILERWPKPVEALPRQATEDMLTEREHEVMVLAAQGHSNAQIGEQLDLALGTVKWHLHNIYEKLRVRNRTQAIRRARELELL